MELQANHTNEIMKRAALKAPGFSKKKKFLKRREKKEGWQQF